MLSMVSILLWRRHDMSHWMRAEDIYRSATSHGLLLCATNRANGERTLPLWAPGGRVNGGTQRTSSLSVDFYSWERDALLALHVHCSTLY